MASNGLLNRAKKGKCRICYRVRCTNKHVKAVGEVRHGFATGHVWECKDIEECENGATIPLILLVYIIPSNENDWVKCTNEGTVLKKEAYWYRLPSGTIRSNNTTSVTIDIPQKNRVTEEFFPNLWTSLF